MLRVEDVSRDNIEDVFRVCSHGRLEDPLQREGMEIKRRWLLDMLEKHGPCTKIAYLDGRPVAQILFYPEEATPYVTEPRKDAVILHCTYNPFPEARGKGASTALLKGLIGEAETGLPCLGGRPCSFVAADPFDTGEGLSLGLFYERSGFKRADSEMYLEITGRYEEPRALEYRPLPEDRGRAVVFYHPVCEWGYPFAVRVRDFLHGLEPSLPVGLIDAWDKPNEYVKRARQQLTVNARIIKSFWTDREAFRKEIEETLRE